MADDARESKAKKLAAARKKLKEYQSRGMESGNLRTSSMTASSTSVASSERSECENSIEGNTPNLLHDMSNMAAANEQAANLSNYFNAHPVNEVAFDVNLLDQKQQQPQQHPQQTMQLTSNYFENAENTTVSAEHNAAATTATTTTSFQTQSEHYQQQQQLNAIQLLIAEKTQLTAELNRWRNLCRDKDETLEELRTQLNTRNQEFEDFQLNFKQQQQSTEQLRKQNAELLHKLSQANAAQEDQTTHVNELQQQLKLAQSQLNEFEQKLNEKSKEYELAQLRIKQISDESNLGKDESLTQNQFMYEQQIRDLQAMVQQFTQDKEQSSIQYQNYVQHLNAEMTKLSERNSDLNDTCTKLQERERQLVEHISELEREIQKNLSLRQTAAENQTTKVKNLESSPPPSADEIDSLKKQIATLEERISDLDFERHEFQLKIKSQEDRLEQMQAALNEKEEALEKISEHLPEQTDQIKLLAAMESDKIAASRAVGQNIKLKEQLNEIETRFVQLTNDKAELTIELDKEIFENRAMHTKINDMEERLASLDAKFQNKDEEMIRLSHENQELTQKNVILQQKIERFQHYDEVKDHSNNYTTEETIDDNETEKNIMHDEHEDHHHYHYHHDNLESHTHHEHTHDDHNDGSCNHESETDTCQEAHELENANHHLHKKQTTNKATTPAHIATAEAVEKLQARFTYLMSQVADLTDEKQRLEHLVMQLQDETETIGEYIALYQQQRRILKQREYEKAAQTSLLQEERERLREKVAQLNELVAKLGLLEKTTATAMPTAAEIKESNDIKAQLQAALAESVSIEPQNGDGKHHDENVCITNKTKMLYNSKEIQNSATSMPTNAAANELLMQIQNIVTEIKENTTRDLPLLDAAQQNNAMEICHCCEGQLKVV